MCGIFVAYNHLGLNQELKDSFRTAIAKVNHRGPDNIGEFLNSKCYLGHSRLAILDVCESSNQPFRYGDLVMTYNGEVFNYEELRIELQNLGHVFRTNSDTEVVIAAYSQWGVECFSRFNGMWALVIYDKVKKEIIVSRDRFGQKPLFGAKVDGMWLFASEPQQLIHLVAADPDYQTIKHFLEEGDSVNGGKTFFRNIEEFPPASYWCHSANDDVTMVRYWDYPTSKGYKSDSQTFNQFEQLLIDSVRLRLRSDVPVAICLSGGVDSTIITDIVRELMPLNSSIAAYTYKAIDAFDESSFAREVAERLNCDLHLVEQPQHPSIYIEKLSLLVKRMGRGHSSPAIISNDCIHENISKDGYRVSIDGQGADELLAGYKTYYFNLIYENFLHLNIVQLIKTIRSLMKQGSQFQFGIVSVVINFIRYNSPPLLRKAMRWIYGYQNLLRDFCNLEIRRSLFSWGGARKRDNSLNSHLIREHSNGLRNLIFYGDAVAMSNSVESRSPFLDHRLVDFVFSHDSKLKVYDGIEKYALRTMKRYEKFSDILDRNKVGFESTIRSATKLEIKNLLRDSQILNWPIFSPQMRRFLDSDAVLSKKYERFVFRLFQVHLWSEQFNGASFSQTNLIKSRIFHET
jgi:asparagine synthase (glutamine-hydrolysing)